MNRRDFARLTLLAGASPVLIKNDRETEIELAEIYPSLPPTPKKIEALHWTGFNGEYGSIVFPWVLHGYHPVTVEVTAKGQSVITVMEVRERETVTLMQRVVHSRVNRVWFA